MKTGFKVGGAVLAVALAGFMLAGPAQADSAQPMPTQTYNWSGLYIGGTTGYLWGNSQHCDGGTGPNACTNSFSVRGFTGGGTLGYNWQADDFVLGVETDLSGASAKGGTSSNASYGCGGSGPICRTQLDWYGTVRGRLGYAGWDDHLPSIVGSRNWLPYVTGGLAYGRIYASVGAPIQTSNNDIRFGWTFGGGIEYAPVKSWSVRLEYLYTALGKLFYDTAQKCGFKSCTAVGNYYNNVRIGADYHF